MEALQLAVQKVQGFDIHRLRNLMIMMKQGDWRHSLRERAEGPSPSEPVAKPLRDKVWRDAKSGEESVHPGIGINNCKPISLLLSSAEIPMR